MLDRMLALLYGRLGPRMFWLVPLLGPAAGAMVFAVIGVVAWRYFATDRLMMVVFCASWWALDVLISIPLFWRAWRDRDPSFSWREPPRTPERAVATCRALVDVQQVVRRATVILIALTPLTAITFTVLFEQPWWFVFPVLAGALAAAGGFATASTAAIAVVQRPLREEAIAHLPSGFETHKFRPSLVMQPVALTPVPMLITAFVVGAFGDIADNGPDRFAVAAAVGLLLVLSISPVVFLRAQAWVAPINELITAAKRVEAGDLTASIPIVGSDEAGALGQQFNAMLVGLREREALRTDLVEREAEVRASRDRVITAADAERRRVERNLHDGAQQRLVALQFDLRLLEDAAMAADQPDLSELAAKARHDLKGALGELRDLARGLHPTVLDSDGLEPAIRQLTDRSTLPTTVSVDVERLPRSVESTLYFVASEALANVAKHARASTVAVTVARSNGNVTLQVSDDGVGGAQATPGSGIGGLADRVDAAGGALRVVSSPGAGTTVEVTIPVEGTTP